MKYFIVDAFANAIFKGNPAGICLLEKELDTFILESAVKKVNAGGGK